jgi:hypothetical protein
VLATHGFENTPSAIASRPLVRSAAINSSGLASSQKFLCMQSGAFEDAAAAQWAAITGAAVVVKLLRMSVKN